MSTMWIILKRLWMQLENAQHRLMILYLYFVLLVVPIQKSRLFDVDRKLKRKSLRPELFLYLPLTFLKVQLVGRGRIL
ncbi:hypothetical protein QTP88_010764 [Uroleucon formosanum]